MPSKKMTTDMDNITPADVRRVCDHMDGTKGYLTLEDAALCVGIAPDTFREFCAESEETDNRTRQALAQARRRLTKKLEDAEDLSTGERQNLQTLIKALDARFNPRKDEEDKTIVVKFGDVPPPPEKHKEEIVDG